MSLLRSLNTAAAGLQSHSQAVGVTGDNIANVNTMGFKRQRANFQDMLGRSIANAQELPMAGAGSRLSHIETMWAQGALLTTDSPTDLAISGDGLFAVRGAAMGVEGTWFTRAGQFKLDDEGRLVNLDGLRLQGYLADEDGDIGAGLGDLRVEGFTFPARMTTEADLSVNLDSNEVATGVGFDLDDIEGTTNSSTNFTVYDSLGNSHQITVYFTKDDVGQWTWNAVVEGPELDGRPDSAPPEVVGTGTLSFDSSGALVDDSGALISVSFANGATPDQQITIDFGESQNEGGTGFDGSTQTASSFATMAIQQDGYAPGQIAGLAIEQDGTITGVFSNGQRRTIGQVAVATFASLEGLDRAGQGLWIETDRSGQAMTGAGMSGGRGAVVAGALEQANVDLGQEFVNLIAYQRGFSANSRIVTTADEMYAELVNLKR